ncbi:MAG: hypothetical protein R3213_07005 [Flavobacteriaceae bacterium]|nr:hypothetical protein [Flavobacteriaceae bacterium]
MKSNYLLLCFIVVLFQSCSTDYQDEVTENSDTTLAEDVIEMMHNSADFNQFRADANSYFMQRTRNPEAGTGHIVISSSRGRIYTFRTEEGHFIHVHGKAEDMKITLLSENKGRFRIHTNEPLVYVEDSNFNPLYSNRCIDNKVGHFNSNVVADYRAVQYDFGMVYYPSGPYETADVLSVSTKVDDSMMEYDEAGNLINCGESSESKSIRINLVKRSHNTQLQDPILKVELN